MDDMDKTIAPRREHISSDADDMTMPGRRDRKPDGRFVVGDLIMNRYKVLAELGQGGMGVVYKCFDETAGIEVALKALPPELSHNTLEMEDIKDNFQLVHNLHHTNIASSNTLEKDNSNGNYYLIMECCEGEDLRRWLRRKRKEGELKLEDVLPIIEQVASALDYAHKQKIIHRDIKPGNIMIAANGDIKVLDFGLAAQIHTSMTNVSMAYHGTSGTGPYMAPEQWRGRAQGTPADQYALAVMTYEMLAGHLPFESSDAAVLKQAVLDENPEDIADISKTAQEAIKRAMSKEPAERFANCSDFAAALGGKKVKAAKVQQKGGFPKWAAGLIIAALLGVGGTGYYFFDKHQKEQARQKQLASLLSSAQTAQKQSNYQEALRFAQEALLLDNNNTVAKNLYDEARRQIIAIENKRNEERMLALKQETYRLQSRIDDLQSQIESTSYDRGQTFEKYLNALKENSNAGKTALKNNDFQTSQASFKVAEQAAEWIKRNAPLRKQTQIFRKQAIEQKKQVDKFNTREIPVSLYNAALQKLSTAEKQYNEGLFNEATANFKLAATEYQKVYQQAKQQVLSNLVTAAQSAQKSKSWNKVKEIAESILIWDKNKAYEFISFADLQIKLEKLNRVLTLAKKAQNQKRWLQMYNYADEALKIDNSCSEAKKIKKEAINYLKPTIEIIATVEGKKVSAKVHLGNKVFSTMNSTIELTEYRNYEALITYQEQKSAYAQKIVFPCDWRGPKQITVQLTDYVAEAEKQGLKLSSDKTTVIGVKDQNIKICKIPFGITVIGDHAFRECKNLKSITIPDGVTSIGERAFYECEKLSNFTLPTSINNIGKFAFYGCKSMTYIQLPINITKIEEGTFWGCEKLWTIHIPDGVTSIGSSAFKCCKSLGEYFELPASVEEIGEYAFFDCEKMTKIRIPMGVKKIEDGTFSFCKNLKEVIIPETVVSIDRSAFSYCKNLTNVAIPGEIASIGSNSFDNIKQIVASQDNPHLEFDTYGCLINKKNKHLLFAPENISGKYTVPSDITHIGNYAFYDCKNLTEITIPGSVVNIGESAFKDCANLSRAVLPSSLTYLGKKAFTGCMALSNIILPDTLTHIEEYTFASCLKLSIQISKNVISMKSNPFIGVSKITVSPENPYFHVDKHGILFDKKRKILIAAPLHFSGYYNIPEGVKNIGDYAFNFLRNLTGVSIPSTVTRIGKQAFRHCKKITKITIPGSVSDIDKEAFSQCRALSTVVLANGIKNIGPRAFYKCSQLSNITIPDSVKSIGEYAFYGCDRLTDVTINGKIENIELGLFMYCPNLANIKFPNSVKNIKLHAFYGCKKLIRIMLPNSIDRIGYHAFKNAGCETQVKQDYLY